MSPTNLGDLPSNQPAPTGLCQIKRGGGGGVNYSNGIAQGTTISDGAGGYMTIAVTPPRPGWWIIRAETIWLMLDATWAYFTWCVSCNPVDANGWGGGGGDWNHMSQHSAQGWQESCIDTAYRLNANTTYTAGMYWGYSQGWTQQIYTGGDYTYISGEFIEDGSL